MLPALASYHSGPPSPALKQWARCPCHPACPQQRVTQGLPSGLKVGSEHGLYLDGPRPVARTVQESQASPHFAIIIKLLADQSLVGTAGVLEERKEEIEPISAHSQPTQVSSLAPTSALPPLLLPSASWRAHTLERERLGLDSPAPPHQLRDLE